MKEKHHKYLKNVYILTILSLITTLVFKGAKLIFLFSIFNFWHDTEFESSIISVLVTSFIVIAIKLRRFLPRILTLQKMRNKEEGTDTDLMAIQKLRRMTRTFIIIYLVAISFDFYALFAVNGDSPILLTIKVFPLAASIILLSITVLLFVYLYHLEKTIKAI